MGRAKVNLSAVTSFMKSSEGMKTSANKMQSTLNEIDQCLVEITNEQKRIAENISQVEQSIISLKNKLAKIKIEIKKLKETLSALRSQLAATPRTIPVEHTYQSGTDEDGNPVYSSYTTYEPNPAYAALEVQISAESSQLSTLENKYNNGENIQSTLLETKQRLHNISETLTKSKVDLSKAKTDILKNLDSIFKCSTNAISVLNRAQKAIQKYLSESVMVDGSITTSPIGTSPQITRTFNNNPGKDIRVAFDHIEHTYDRTSVEWQEAANRQIEANRVKIDAIQDRYAELTKEKALIEKEISDYIRQNEMTIEKCRTDPVYQELLCRREEIVGEYESYNTRINSYKTQNELLSEYIDKSMITTFRGRNNSSFDSAYNGMNTLPQGYVVEGYRGVCGVVECANVYNQQTGKRKSEAEAIKDFVGHDPPLCETMSAKPSHNGGTMPSQRERYLTEKGLTFEVIEGSYHKAPTLTLEEMSRRFNDGESIGLRLRSQDLDQPELSKRKRIKKENGFGWTLTNSTNHMTTVAGFSYNSDGNPIGVWINDTAGVRPNRLFISADKFYKMQRKTRGFQAECSKLKNN